MHQCNRQEINVSDEFILSIDQGTTSSRALAFARNGQVRGVGQSEFRQIFPADGWVEHDAMEIWQTTLQVCRQVLDENGVENCAGIGITNQRETVVLWDRATGQPLANAIVWQDRRTADFCDDLKSQGHEAMVTAKTGLLLDPYFSASKLAWLLDHIDGARARAEAGTLAFGTIDSWLVWNLTNGQAHVTDASNAARTSCLTFTTINGMTRYWRCLISPPACCPKCATMPPISVIARHGFGGKPADLWHGRRPAGGDHWPGLFCPGMIKSTYGTGCFVLANTGTRAVASQNRLLTTIGYRLNGQTHYALEGSIFMAGAIVQWLRDGLQIIEKATETQELAEQARADSQVVMVPAFTGLGAPHWAPNARAAIFQYDARYRARPILSAPRWKAVAANRRFNAAMDR
jgi:glycerol kinase